jgi:hypothetical protein
MRLWAGRGSVPAIHSAPNRAKVEDVWSYAYVLMVWPLIKEEWVYLTAALPGDLFYE